MRVGGSDYTVNATVSPIDATNKSLAWTSSNINVATVNSNGTVHVIASGIAIISAKSNQDPTKTATCTILVPAPTKHY